MPCREEKYQSEFVKEKFHVIKLHFPVNRNVLHFFDVGNALSTQLDIHNA